MGQCSVCNNFEKAREIWKPPSFKVSKCKKRRENGGIHAEVAEEFRKDHEWHNAIGSLYKREQNSVAVFALILCSLCMKGISG
jgi:hypothetical protein